VFCITVAAFSSPRFVERDPAIRRGFVKDVVGLVLLRTPRDTPEVDVKYDGVQPEIGL